MSDSDFKNEVTILIAEDDDGHAELIHEHLIDAGVMNRQIRFRDGKEVWDFISGENQRIAQPDIVEFLPLVETQDSIAAWKLDLYQSGRLIKTLRGTGDPQSIEWNISPNDLTDKEMPVSYTLDVQDNYNGEKPITGSIPVEYISISKK